MQFNAFISTSLAILTSPFLQLPALAYPHSPSTFFIELFFKDQTKKIKLEEWKFQIKRKGTSNDKGLIESEEDEEDREEEREEIRSFFEELENVRQEIQPQVFMKQNKIMARIVPEMKYQASELIPFDGRSTFHLQLSTFSSATFLCFLSLKYNYEEDEPSIMSEPNQEESEDEFELLIDQSYEKRKIQEAKQQNRKWSQNAIVVVNDIALSPLKSTGKQKQQKTDRLRDIMKDINWKSIRNKTVGQFIQEHRGTK